VALVQHHCRKRPDLDADLDAVVQAGEGSNGAAPRHRQRYTAAIVRLGDPHPGFGLSLWIGDCVEDNVAIRPEDLRGDDNP
jgi:hypothetical protein